MDLETRDIDGVIILDIEGEINLNNAPNIRDLADKLIAEGKDKIIVNMESVDAIDSSGIGALVYILKKLKEADGTLKICALSAATRRIMELMKLNRVFSIHDSEDEALAAM